MLSRMFFLRQTDHPTDDIARGFSCNVNGWVGSMEEAVAEREARGGDSAFVGPAFQDPANGLWCFDPEPGLFSFGFHDERSFDMVKERIASYVYEEAQRVAVFESDDFDLDAGLDGEDVFRKGAFLFYIEGLPSTTFQDFLVYLSHYRSTT